jgi:hypothetical protein
LIAAFSVLSAVPASAAPQWELTELALRGGQLWAGGTSTATTLVWDGQAWRAGPKPPLYSSPISALSGGLDGTLWAAGTGYPDSLSFGEPLLARLVG